MSFRFCTTAARPLALGCALLASPCYAAQADGLDFSPTANIQYDWARFESDDVRLRDDDAFRRARVGFKLKGADGRWQLVAEHDLAENTPPDAFVEITPAKGHSLRIGQFKQPFLLEDAVSDKHALFMEQSLLGAFGISRRIGVEYARQAARGTINAAVFDQRLDGSNASRGFTTRATWRLREREGEVLHIGGGLASESPDNTRAAFSAGPGTALTEVKLARSGSMTRVDRVNRAALEGLWLRGAWSLQGELAQVTARRDGADFVGNAQSLLATWSPTGDARSYRRGVVGAPSVDDGPAWEFALRWSAIDLHDGAIAGGEVENLGAAATYYANSYLRVMVNLIHSRRDGAQDSPTTAGLRVQVTY
ncbi:OprO/OprP family phosphate-selective porin [Lysobacter korlensis]|uniref:OprO/OprP family phosphate-selective porin n=1 Tax=Lysobacter korlensis TaxID=553636 RepID=A0ABV6RJ82_9GAMM